MSKIKSKKKQRNTKITGKKAHSKLEGWITFALVIIIALILRATIVQAFTIPSGSMENSLLIGDFLIGEKLTFLFREPERGEIIIFRHTKVPGRDLIKRCVAVAGDTVAVVNKELFINGELSPLPPEGKHIDPRLFPRRDNFGPYIVPDGHVFAMGDNRDNSEDSRFLDKLGPIPLENIKARPLFCYFSVDLGTEARTIKNSIDIYRVLLKRLFRFPPAIQFKRIGIIVH